MLQLLSHRKSYRILSTILALVFTLNLIAPPIVLAKTPSKTEEAQEVQQPQQSIVSIVGNWIAGIPKRAGRKFKSKDGFDSADEAQDVIDNSPNKTYNANLSKRTSDSGIMYPIKQIGLSVIDKEIGIVTRFLSKSVVDTLSKAGKGPAVSQTWQKASKVIASMTPKQLSTLNRNLQGSSISKAVSNFSRRNQLGATIRGDASMAAIGLVAALIDKGLYDGLDLSTLKDNVINMSAICCMVKPQQSLVSMPIMMVASKHSYEALSRVFDRLYFRALKSPAVSSMDKAIAMLGSKIHKPTRLGLVGKTVTDGSKKVGLYDIGGAAKLTMHGLTKSMFMGATMGVALNAVFQVGYKLIEGIPQSVVIGGDRNKLYATPELYNLYYQKTGDKQKDWWQNRKTAISNVIDGYRKWPVARIMGGMGGFMGGYLGSILAGVLICTTGPIGLIAGIGISAVVAGIGGFIGDWMGAKIDQSKWMYDRKRRSRERQLLREMRGMGSPGGMINKDIAQSLALDFEQLERIGQVGSRIKFVKNFDDIKVAKTGDYWDITIEDQNGMRFNTHANTRYDFIDMNGNRGIYDPETKTIINVGKIRKNNGRHMVIVSSKDIAAMKGGTFIGKSVRVLSNGIVIKKRAEKWYVVGNGPEYDVFVRDTGERYAWDGKTYNKTGEAPVPQAKASVKITEEPVEPEESDQGWQGALEKIGQ